MASKIMPSTTNSGNGISPTESSHGSTYKQKYRILKRKLKFLLYEQESFQEELRRSQRRLLRASKDKSFLLDQLLQVEGLDFLSSEDEETAVSSSDDEQQKSAAVDGAPKEKRSKKQSTAPVDPSSEATSSQDAKIDNNNQIRCKFAENGKQCVKYVSKRAKSGYCTTHKTVIRIAKQNNSSNQASQLLPSTDGQLHSDLAHLNELHLLRNQESTEFPETSATLPQDVFSMNDDDIVSDNEESTESHSFPNSIYEGDDDLVIDLPE
ncbi:uncharacterized protein LOC124447384 isoform X1 [Xenia sp. Carnegie-2017]|uniref:uncharacterized protein LOC124447384 isoform X1 n=1 Tax=Xenia sp. Carnegie-2017 TaxID=2897299 RepID=UPI001F0356B5|nr:uncharacterized protein LOC124447384 isoform X1 [Xenia sp. Carnegie-2017]